MKILIVNFTDTIGGASRAAYRLHEALILAGMDSIMLVSIKKSTSNRVFGPTTLIGKFLVKISAKLNLLPLKKYGREKLFSPSFTSNLNLINHINKLNPDIVHLHWIHAGMLRIEDLNKINAPIVWSLHDMWAFTGGCHYSDNCTNYTQSCGFCPILDYNMENDLSKQIFNRKEYAYPKIKSLTIIGLSRWIQKKAQESKLLKNKEVINLPNTINTKVFKPLDKIAARRRWRLPIDKNLILFGSMSATSDVRKGFKELSQALKELNHDMLELVIYGNTESSRSYEFGFRYHLLGNIDDDQKLISLYNAANVMVVPSLQENLSNVIMESLACGTPVVAFNIGGNSDLIDHLENGYLAKPNDPKDLANGISWVLRDNNVEISKNARKKIETHYKYEIVSKQYIQLYNKINERHKIC